MRAIWFSWMPSTCDQNVFLFSLNLVISNMKKRDFDSWQTLSKNTSFDPLRRESLYFVEKSAKGERNTISKENLVVLVLKFVLKLKAVVMHHMGRNLILKEFITQLFSCHSKVYTSLSPTFSVHSIGFFWKYIRLQTLHNVWITES